jgi:hypothetical protein
VSRTRRTYGGDDVDLPAVRVSAENRLFTARTLPHSHSNTPTIAWYFSMYQRFSLLYLGIATARTSVPCAFQRHGQVTDAPATCAPGGPNHTVSGSTGATAHHLRSPQLRALLWTTASSPSGFASSRRPDFNDLIPDPAAISRINALEYHSACKRIAPGWYISVNFRARALPTSPRCRISRPEQDTDQIDVAVAVTRSEQVGALECAGQMVGGR